MVDSARVVVNLSEIEGDDKHIVGEHASHMGGLKKIDITTPEGFVITPAAYFSFIAHKDLDTKIGHLLGSIDYSNPASLEKVSDHIKNLITRSEIPQHILTEIFESYENLGSESVSIHTSIISGDSSQNQFPREYTFEEVAGEAVLAEILREFWASLFDMELIDYRNTNGVDHLKTGIAATVKSKNQNTASGKIYTVDPYSNDRTKMVIEEDGKRQHVVIGKADELIEKRRHPYLPKVYVTNGVVYDELSDINFEELFRIAKSIEGYFYAPCEISWVFSNGKFHIVAVNPINIYGTN